MNGQMAFSHDLWHVFPILNYIRRNVFCRVTHQSRWKSWNCLWPRVRKLLVGLCSWFLEDGSFGPHRTTRSAIKDILHISEQWCQKTHFAHDGTKKITKYSTIIYSNTFFLSIFSSVPNPVMWKEKQYKLLV